MLYDTCFARGGIQSHCDKSPILFLFPKSCVPHILSSGVVSRLIALRMHCKVIRSNTGLLCIPQAFGYFKVVYELLTTVNSSP